MPDLARDISPISPMTEATGTHVVDSGFKVHSALGPGLLESSYEHCLVYELESRGLHVERQRSLPIVYRGVNIDAGYRIDLVVENSVIVELKSVDVIAPVHEAQLLTYLKLSGCRLGFLVNFNVPLFKQGVRRRVL